MKAVTSRTARRAAAIIVNDLFNLQLTGSF
jgi:hypothetical protein